METKEKILKTKEIEIKSVKIKINFKDGLDRTVTIKDSVTPSKLGFFTLDAEEIAIDAIKRWGEMNGVIINGLYSPMENVNNIEILHTIPAYKEKYNLIAQRAKLPNPLWLFGWQTMGWKKAPTDNSISGHCKT